MPSNSEMYERGAFDAEQDELNPFYYQHYYYYRRGYDDARRQLRREGGSGAGGGWGYRQLLLGLAIGAAAALAAVMLYMSGVVGPAAAPTEEPVALETTRPTARPTAQPTATAQPSPQPTPIPVLAVGGRARVANLNGSPLRAREAPSLQGRVAARFPEGSEVTLQEGPVEADGYRWWRVEGGGATGWVAEGSPEGAAFLVPTP